MVLRNSNISFLYLCRMFGLFEEIIVLLSYLKISYRILLIVSAIQHHLIANGMLRFDWVLLGYSLLQLLIKYGINNSICICSIILQKFIDTATISTKPYRVKICVQYENPRNHEQLCSLLLRFHCHQYEMHSNILLDCHMSNMHLLEHK